jgi:hypothetical protein
LLLNDNLGTLGFIGQTNGSTNYSMSGVKSFYKGDGITNLSNLLFQTSGTDRAIITETGNYGIGTITPTQKLEVSSGTAGLSGVKMTNFPSVSILGTDATGLIIPSTAVLSTVTMMKTPINSGPETVVSFDNLEMKWHASSTASYDGIAIRTTLATPQSINYSSSETYLANAVADAGKATWGSDNAFYALPALTTIANVTNTVYPYASNVTTAWMGIGNPALTNSHTRIYFITNNTSGLRYRVTCVKKASTGEVLTAQNGICDIYVEKL